MKTTLNTTLKLLCRHNACDGRLEAILDSLPKNYPKDKTINLLHILESNGINYFFWSWRATTEKGLEVKRMILHDIIASIKHLHPDQKVIRQVLKALKSGEGVKEARNAAYAAYAAAYADAADAAAYAAAAAAYAAATAAAYAATYATAATKAN